MAAEIREVQARGEELLILLSLATGVREEWLRELYPEDFQEPHTEYYDQALRRVVARTDLIFRDLFRLRPDVEETNSKQYRDEQQSQKE